MLYLSTAAGAAVLEWGDAESGFEFSCQVIRIGKTAEYGNFIDRFVGVGKQLFYIFHAFIGDILPYCCSQMFAEKSGES